MTLYTQLPSRWRLSGLVWGLLALLSCIGAPAMMLFAIWVDYQIWAQGFSIPLGVVLIFLGLLLAFLSLSVSPFRVPETESRFARMVNGYLHLVAALFVPLWIAFFTWQVESFARFVLVFVAFGLAVNMRRWQAQYSLPRPSLPVRILEHSRQMALSVIVGLLSAFYVGVPVFLPYR